MDTLEEAKLLAERIEKANEVARELLERQEKLRVQEILGGKSEAGIPVPEVNKAEKLMTETKEAFKGTVLDGLI